MGKKKILTEEQQQLKKQKKEEQQQKKEDQEIKNAIYKHKKLISLNKKMSLCDISTLKLIYAYLIKEKIMFYNDDNNDDDTESGDIVKFDMMGMSNENIKIVNAIIKDNFKPVIKTTKITNKPVNKATKKQKIKPVINYNNELILFNDN
jgi:hypothetical protein